MEGGSARQHADAGGRAAAAAGRRAGEIAGGVLAGGRRHGSPFEPRTQCCGLNLECPLRQAWHANIDPGGARGGTKVSQLHNKIHVACSWYVVTSSSSFYLRNFFLQLSGSLIIFRK